MGKTKEAPKKGRRKENEVRNFSFENLKEIFNKGIQPVPDLETVHFKKLIDNIDKRQQFRDDILGSTKTLSDYIKNQLRCDKIRDQIDRIVKAKGFSLKVISKVEGYLNIEKKEPLEKYITLVKYNWVEAADIFPEMPGKISLYELKIINDKIKELTSNLSPEEQTRIINLVLNELTRNVIKTYNDWFLIMGVKIEPFDEKGLPDLTKIPSLNELELKKSSITMNPAWTRKLHSVEAKKMGHKSIEDVHNKKVNSSWEYWTKAPKENSINVEKNKNTSENGANANSNNSVASNNLNVQNSNNSFKLYDSDSFEPLKPPSPNNRYTFPGELLRAEDLFYDYCVILPLGSKYTDSDNKEEKVNEDGKPRNLDAAKILAGKANSIIDFLKLQGLAYLLGSWDNSNNSHLTINRISEILESVHNLDQQTDCKLSDSYDEKDIKEIRRLKDKLKSLAGVLRTIAKTEMLLFSLEATNPAQHLSNLKSALIDFPEFGLVNRKMPTTSGVKNGSTLIFRGVDKKYWGRENVGKCINVPDTALYEDFEINYITEDGGTLPDKDGNKGYTWGPGKRYVDKPSSVPGRCAERYDLRNYIRYLGDNEPGSDTKKPGFHYALRNLVDSAEFVKKDLDKFTGNHGLFNSDFEKLVSGIVQHATYSLAEILDEIAEQLTLPVCVPEEGSKRLGLQVIYRQYWHPAGYVQGKLVGYKNLLPNQKESFKQRTFIKTTREMTTAEEYTSAREDDQSHTQKETSEVLKEASKKFDFSASAQGDYDFLVTSGEYKIESGVELANSSKNTQNRLTESTRKSSNKYNEKREVKIKEIVETEDVKEVTRELENSNAEITANYFYYQLLRQYNVTVEFNDIKPVLLRTKDVPNPAEIDEHFIIKHIHILLHRLPNQLSVDAQENAEKIGYLAKTLVRRKANMDELAAELNIQRNEAKYDDGGNNSTEELKSKERELFEARQEYIEIEQEYSIARMRMNRVITHLRENIIYYMQFIWQESPKVDQDQILNKEIFQGSRLPEITRGLIRQGYYGREEIFNYTGSSYALMEVILENLKPGSEICSLHNIEVKEQRITTAKEQKLSHSYIYPESVRIIDAIMTNGKPIDENGCKIHYENGVISFPMELKSNSKPKISYDSYQELTKTALFQYMKFYYPEESDLELAYKINELTFISDPANNDFKSPKSILNSTLVQVAQDALVVEAMPGHVPLLEGFQMANRKIHTERELLENEHLKGRIASKQWEKSGEDSYHHTTYDGVPVNLNND